MNPFKCILALFPMEMQVIIHSYQLYWRFSHGNASHYSFLPTGRNSGSVGGALRRLSGSRVE